MAVSSYDVEVRSRLVDILVEVGIFGLRDQGLEQAFIVAEIDPSFADLGLDSLSEMEFCIAIENEYGLSITPVELVKAKTLGTILRRISSSQ